MEHEQPDWLAYAEPEWGFGRVTVDGRRGELLFEFVRSEDGAVRDSVVLRNSRAGARACQRGGPNPSPGSGAGAVFLTPNPNLRVSAAAAGSGAAEGDARGAAGAPALASPAARVQGTGSVPTGGGAGNIISAQKRSAVGWRAVSAAGVSRGIGERDAVGLDAE